MATAQKYFMLLHQVQQCESRLILWLSRGAPDYFLELPNMHVMIRGLSRLDNVVFPRIKRVNIKMK